MKIKFKEQAYQHDAVRAVVDCFDGQPFGNGSRYRVNFGTNINKNDQKEAEVISAGLRNADLVLDRDTILKNINKVQLRNNLTLSERLSDQIAPINLDIEMETGTGKTYCYIRTMLELNKIYGWNKFIVVVPSIAIREGVAKSFEMTGEHFLMDYGKKPRFFIYDSKSLSQLEGFSSDSGINVMIINIQAFNASGKDARRIRMVLDGFQSRRPIDVISATQPIIVLDEPQKMEGEKTLQSLCEFNPMMILRYSATHKTEHNKIYRLDALDAYQHKLVKKIAVRGISVKGLSGTNAYLYLQSIEISKLAPEAQLEFEIKQKTGIKRVTRKLKKNDNLYLLSNELDEYKGFVIADIDARQNIVSFTNGVEIEAGEAFGDVHETTLRRIQIREAIAAHLEREQSNFDRDIKTLSLFFIDEVSKYRFYDRDGQHSGEYARIFEEEYDKAINAIGLLENTPYHQYLTKIPASKTHNGYFSIDKKTRRFVDPKISKRCAETDDVDAYDLILKDKERLLSFEEPTRFIFSHSALREGWDNPNIFVICALKHSDNTTSRRQEVGRGLRLSVNKNGERQDEPTIVHDINILTVVASESYETFVKGLQEDICSSISRSLTANEAYFTGKTLATENGTIIVSAQMAKQLYHYLVKNDYIDDNDKITDVYRTAKKQQKLAPLPSPLNDNQDAFFTLVNSVFDPKIFNTIDNARRQKNNLINDNFKKKEFQALWSKINRKTVYSVDFKSEELIERAAKVLEDKLRVSSLQYRVTIGSLSSKASYEKLKEGRAFDVTLNKPTTEKTIIGCSIRYDLVGKIGELTGLTRRTIAAILTKIDKAIFSQFKLNPEDFIANAARLINEQKATMVVEHLAYNPLHETFETSIFTQDKKLNDFDAAYLAKRHIYDYVETDSKNERDFVEQLDKSDEVVVYAKLPTGFYIPTPVGNYNPDWAIAFKEGAVKHIYFVAETKGSLSSLQLREIEKSKINCARKFFEKMTTNDVKYDVIENYSQLMQVIN